ncbi:MAG: RNA methyltransferase [Candidatus Cloacimonetes bacterium]|nr:RNA methyltransferase [Candidatus Cloacimonadota bacterium]
MKNNIYLALIHYPVYNKFRETVNTSITNLDIHDIARTCLTFGIRKYFLVTPLASQQEMLNRILAFWNTEAAIKYNPDRNQALAGIAYSPSLTETKKTIFSQEKLDPVVVSTTAVIRDDQTSFAHLKKELITSERPCLILFGTGNGLTEEILTESDYILEPIQGISNYNHLSVRSAAAIILDRLLSEK